MCSKCANDYYELNSVCLPCNGGNLELSILSVLVFGYFVFLGVSLIYCSDKWLEYVTIFIVTTQQILSAGDGECNLCFKLKTQPSHMSCSSCN